MKILVCGDRNWKNKELIKDELITASGIGHPGTPTPSPKDILVIEGDARGADKLAGEVAKELGFRVAVFPAQWERFGKMAGPLRNIEMLDEKPDLVLAFHNDLSKSKGTAHTVKNAQKRGIKVKVISEGDKNGS